MTPEELEKLPKPLERIMTALELNIMSEIIERIKGAAQITPVTDWLLNRLSIIGASKQTHEADSERSTGDGKSTGG